MSNYSTPKQRRCYHRVISGIERGGHLRFLTLTSGPESPENCQRSWRMLYMRLLRRKLISGYIKVPEYTKAGKQHLHVIFRGSYIEQAYISALWNEIHNAKIVDIRLIKKLNRKGNIAAYMAKYMAKEGACRYSWSWGWVWRGFVKDWKNLCRLWRARLACGFDYPFSVLTGLWRLWLKDQWRPNFLVLNLAPDEVNHHHNGIYDSYA